ncbi:unnamed protein product [Clonostachys solani]|uniref:Uncharacterized protein n=1 Tax=Clonostachys solani TaxID=160281 RepID=A0A9N9W4W0_9HYPO|nr:unnamed protein product [Clonostachys solani]
MAKNLESARNERNASAENADHPNHSISSATPRDGQPSGTSSSFSSSLFVGDGQSRDISSTNEDSSSGGPQPSSSNNAEPGSEEQVAPVPQSPVISDDVDTRDTPAAKPKRGPNAGTVAKRFYRNGNGNNVKIDSLVGKRLARLPAQRNPEPRDRTHKPNMKRRGNVEAMLVQVAGEEPHHACRNCRKGHGPWARCVIMEGSLCGSCANCWYNACGSRCTFHDSKTKYETTSHHQPPQATSPNALPLGPYPPQPPFHQAPGPSASPLMPTYAPPPIPAYPPPPPPMPSYPPPPPVQSYPPPHPIPMQQPAGAPGPYSAPIGRQLLSRFAHWNISASTAEAVAQACTLDPRERSHARVQAAAEELGMLIADHAQQFGDEPDTYPSPAPVALMAPD